MGRFKGKEDGEGCLGRFIAELDGRGVWGGSWQSGRRLPRCSDPPPGAEANLSTEVLGELQWICQSSTDLTVQPCTVLSPCPVLPGV